MKFFVIVTLISTVLLLKNASIDPKTMPKRLKFELIHEFKSTYIERFERTENGSFSWAMLTGEKSGITSKTKSDLNKLNLVFLLSPSALHFCFIFAFLFRFLRKKNWIKLAILLGLYLFPFLALKRIIIFKILNMMKRLFKVRLSIEAVFLMTFFLSFLLGHYQQSPLGFSYSFLYFGTYISLKDYRRGILLLGLLSSHLLVHYFSGEELSPFIPLTAIAFTFIASLLIPMNAFYFLTGALTPNWIEKLVRLFIIAVHWGAKWIRPTMLNPSLILIAAVWILLLKKEKKYFLIALLLHGNFANSPVCFSSGPYSPRPQQFVGK